MRCKRLLGFTFLAGLSLLAFTGCASKEIEPEGIDLHAGHSNSGAAWRYRTSHEPETIITGSSQIDVQGSLARYREIWAGLPGRGAHVQRAQDNISEVLTISLDRSALAKNNPFRGGINNWWYKEVYPRLLESAHVAKGGKTGEYRYSIHLAARTTERSLLYNDVAEAQYKLRHLGAWLIEDGIDPRMITGQVVESSDAPRDAWELAIVIRPHQYGKERTAETFLPAWLY